MRSTSWIAAGADVKAQVAVRPIGVLIGLQATANPFMFCPSYRQLHTLDHAERLARLRDPEVRRTLLAEHAASSPSGFVGILHSGYDRMYPLSDPPDYEPTPADSVAGRAATTGAEPAELLYDLLLDDDGSRLLYIPLMNYATRRSRRRARDVDLAEFDVRAVRRRRPLQLDLRRQLPDDGDHALDPRPDSRRPD